MKSGVLILKVLQICFTSTLRKREVFDKESKHFASVKIWVCNYMVSLRTQRKAAVRSCKIGEVEIGRTIQSFRTDFHPFLIV